MPSSCSFCKGPGHRSNRCILKALDDKDVFKARNIFHRNYKVEHYVDYSHRNIKRLLKGESLDVSSDIPPNVLDIQSSPAPIMSSKDNVIVDGGKEKCQNESVTCSVCLCNIDEDEPACMLKCKHTFHTDCILPWISKEGNCPNCRDNVEFKKISPTADDARKIYFGTIVDTLSVLDGCHHAGQLAWHFNGIHEKIEFVRCCYDEIFEYMKSQNIVVNKSKRGKQRIFDSKFLADVRFMIEYDNPHVDDVIHI